MNKKPRLSFMQIWNMSFGFLGIQMGFALQNANTSRIFETLGANTENLAVYWLAAPITGLIMQPIIGYYSDRTWSARWGRRRPYFAFGAIAIDEKPKTAGEKKPANLAKQLEPFRSLLGKTYTGNSSDAKNKAVDV